jgi:outer membrane protein insertion porin family
MFVGNVEYIYPLLDFLKIATFFDTGNVWKKNKDFLSGDLKSGIGFGLRVKTPIGPVSVDYGWPLDTEPGEEGKEGRFYFSVSKGF